MQKKLTSIIGWGGVIAILLAYALVTFGLVQVKSYPYQLLNLLGAIGVVVEALSKKDMQPVALNVIWALVAVVAIAQLVIH